MSQDFTQLFLDSLKQANRRPSIHQYQPHEPQKKFHSSKKTGTLFLGGNRSGKTVGGAVESIWRLTGQHPFKKVPPAPIRGRGVAVDIEDGLKKIMLPEIAKWIPPSLLKNGSWEDSYDKQSRILTCSNESTMDFLTYEQDTEKHAGTSRHFFWFDEEGPKEIFNENLLRLVDTGGQWFMTMTPLLGLTWVYEEYYRPMMEDGVVNENVLLILTSTDDNPHISMAHLEMMMEGMSEEEKDARRHGKFLAFSGQVYREFNEDKVVVDPVLPESLRESMIVLGMDHGYRNPTAFLFASIDADGNVLVFDEHYQSGWTVDQHTEFILNYLEDHRLEAQYCVGDPSIAQTNGITGTSIHQTYAEYGLPIVLGSKDVKLGIDRVRNYMDSGKLHITRNCVSLIRELRGYRWAPKPKASKNDPREAVQKYNDHAVDALRYLIVSRPENDSGSTPVEPEFRPRASTYSTNRDEELYEQRPDSFHEILGYDW